MFHRHLRFNIWEIVFAEVNPKLHDLQTLAESLERFGMVEDPVINETTMRLVVGHGRIEALRALHRAGKDAPDGVLVDSGRWYVECKIVKFRSDAEAQAYLYTSNIAGLQGGDFTIFDFTRLFEPEAFLRDMQQLTLAQALPPGLDPEDIEAACRATAEDDKERDPSEPEPQWITCPNCGKRFTRD